MSAINQFENNYFERMRRTTVLHQSPTIYLKLASLMGYRAAIAQQILKMKSGQGKEEAMRLFNNIESEIKTLLQL